jgi:hypothetical protein
MWVELLYGSRKWTLSVAQSQGLAELMPAAPMSKLKKNEVIHCRSCSNGKRWFSLQHLSKRLLMFGWYGAVMGEHFWKGEICSAVHTDLLDVCHKLVSCAWVFEGSTCTAEFSGQMVGWISVC